MVSELTGIAGAVVLFLAVLVIACKIKEKEEEY